MKKFDLQKDIIMKKNEEEEEERYRQQKSLKTHESL